MSRDHPRITQIGLEFLDGSGVTNKLSTEPWGDDFGEQTREASPWVELIRGNLRKGFAR